MGGGGWGCASGSQILILYHRVTISLRSVYRWWGTGCGGQMVGGPGVRGEQVVRGQVVGGQVVGGQVVGDRWWGDRW